MLAVSVDARRFFSVLFYTVESNQPQRDLVYTQNGRAI